MSKIKDNTPNARNIALKTLEQIWLNNAYANIALNKELNNYKNLAENDRRFVTELVYGATKAGRVLDVLVEKISSRKLIKIAPVILNILRLGFFQLFYLEKIPKPAVVNETVKQAKKFGHMGSIKFVNAVMRNAVRFYESDDFKSDTNFKKQLLLQHPQWLIDHWRDRVGIENAEKICSYNNKNAKITIRCNNLKTNRKTLLTLLENENIKAEKSELCAEGIVVSHMLNLKNLDSFQKGYYQVQSESSMLVANYVNAKENDCILDLCAAPGGKTTHIAETMNNKGRIIACDIYEHKLKLINENARRLGINIIETKLNDATKENKSFFNIADKILIDAPCSGLGVLGRRPDARWHKTFEDIKVFPLLQKSILNIATKYLKKGGTIIYSTCTTIYDENQGLINNFLEKNNDFILQKIQHPKNNVSCDFIELWPHIDDTDGFFICALKHKG